MVYLQPEILTPSLTAIHDHKDDDDLGFEGMKESTQPSSAAEAHAPDPLEEALQLLRRLPKDVVQSAIARGPEELRRAMQGSELRF